MIKLFVFFGFMCASLFLFSQNSYVIQYDKLSNKFTYKKVVFESTGDKKELDLKGKLPKLIQGDNVVVEVINYNPFLYYVEIEEKENLQPTVKKGNSFALLNMMTSGLSPLSSFMTGLSTMQNEFSRRGEEAIAVNESELELYLNETKMLSNIIQEYNSKYEIYKQILAQIESEELPLNVKSVIKKLEDIYKNYNNLTDKIEFLSSSSNFHFNKAGVTDVNLKESAISFDYQLNKFKELLANAENIYNKKEIGEWISKLKSAEFKMKKSFVISSQSKLFSLTNFEDNELNNKFLVGIQYKIKFYRLSDLKELLSLKVSESSPNYVKYYYSNKFWNPKGEIVDTFCFDCKPVLRAEGLYNGQAPRNLTGIFRDQNIEKNELNEEAEGKWTFYDENGGISNILIAPESDPIRKNFKQELKLEDMNQVYSISKTVDFPIKHNVTMNWSTGFYSIGSFMERNTYFSKENPSMDSVTISETKLSRSLICIGSQMAFDFQGNKVITPSINLGAAVDFWDDRDIHFLLGGGLKFKHFQYLSLSAGISFTRVNILNPSLQVGQTYKLENISGNVQSKKYVPGYYIGLNISF
jgi:hypothetical protein